MIPPYMGRKTIIAALLAVALVGCEKSKEEGQREALQKVAEALVAEAISTVDPGFRLTQLIQTYPRPQSVAWQITNTRDDPLRCTPAGRSRTSASSADRSRSRST